MKKGKYMALTLATSVALLIAGCGNSTQNTDDSKAAESTASISSQSAEPSLSAADSSSDSQKDTSNTTTTTDSGTSQSDSSSSNDQTTTSSQTEKQSDSSKKTETTTVATTASSAAKTTSSTASTTVSQQSASGPSNNALIPKSGQWIGSVVVCDRNTPNIRGLISFGGSEGMAKNFCSMVNDMKKMVGSGVNVYTMGAPVSSAFYKPKSMSGVTSDQHKAITDLSKFLRSDVKNIDTYAALAPHVNEYIYYRTDHHWTELAAYYAAEAFAKSAGVPFKPLSEYQAGVKKGFTGSMLTYSGCQEFKTYPDTYYYWKPKNSYTTTYYNGSFQNGQKSSLFLDWASGAGCYCTVLGSDMNLAEIKTDVKNGRTLVLIKDSYGNALVPYFVGSFEKIYVLDMRYTKVKLSSFFKQIGATDILFGSSLSSFYTPSRVSGIRAIM